MKICICYSVDYIPHPLEKHYIHQGEKYQPPEGEMDMMTNYCREYTSMYHSIIFTVTVSLAAQLRPCLWEPLIFEYHFYSDSIYAIAYLHNLWQFRLSVRLSVCHTGGSVQNG